MNKGSSLPAVRASGRAEAGDAQALERRDSGTPKSDAHAAFQLELSLLLGEPDAPDDADDEHKSPDALAAKLVSMRGKQSTQLKGLLAQDAREFGTLLSRVPASLISVPGGAGVVPVSRRQVDVKRANQHQALLDIETSSEGERRRAWAHRFVTLGEAWVRKLRHCGWRQSLRMAFEMPALYSARDAENGYLISRPRFVAAVNFAIIRNPKFLTATELDDVVGAGFDAFDVEGRGTIDYREFCAAFLFFRIPASNDPMLLLETWYRQFDGDVHGGLTVGEFLRSVTTLCTSPDEALALLKLVNVKALVNAPAAMAARRAKQSAAGLYSDVVSDEEGEGEEEEAGGGGEEGGGDVEHSRTHTPYLNGGGDGPAGDSKVMEEGGRRGGGALPVRRRVVDVGMLDASTGAIVGVRGAITLLPRSPTTRSGTTPEPGRGGKAQLSPLQGRGERPAPGGRVGGGGGAGAAAPAPTPAATAGGYGTDATASEGEGGAGGARDTLASKSRRMLSSRGSARRDPLTEAVEARFKEAALPEVEDDDPEAPWNRGAGTLTEVRFYGKRAKAAGKGVHTTASLPANSLLAAESRLAHRRDSDMWEEAFGIEGMKQKGGTRQHSRDAIDAQLRRARAQTPVSAHLDPFKGQRDAYAAGMAKARTIRELKNELGSASGQRRRDLKATLQELIGRPMSEAEMEEGSAEWDALGGGTDGGEGEEGSGGGEGGQGDGAATSPHLRNDPLGRTGVFRKPDTGGVTSPTSNKLAAQADILTHADAVSQMDSLPLLNKHIARVLDPTRLPNGRITLQMVRYMVKKSPGLLQELHRLRLLRLPPIIRSAYLSWQLDTQIKLAQQRFASLREEVLSKRALALWRAKQMSNIFSGWKGWTRYVLWRRVKVNSLRARRACRQWYLATKGSVAESAGSHAAVTHYMITLLRKTFGGWKRFRLLKTQVADVGEARSVAFNRNVLLGKGFESLRDAMMDGRATRYFAAWMAKHCFRAWVAYVNNTKQERAAAEVAARVLEERLKSTAAFLDVEERERLEAAQRDAEARAYKEFMIEAERAAEAKRSEEMRLKAERKLRNSRVKARQEEELHAAAVGRGAAFTASFESEWDEKIRVAVSAARQSATDYCFSKEGREGMKEDAKALLMAETVEQVTQRESDFTPRFDMSDGCIHFSCASDPDVFSSDFPRGRPALDLNMDAMQLREAIYVSTAHYVAKKGVLCTEGMLMDKVRAWRAAREGRLKALLFKRVQSINRKRELKQALRECYESVIDPYTGKVYYVAVSTGRQFDEKPLLFGREDVHPLPEWQLRCSAESGEWYYQHRRVPWRVSPDPPIGFRICYACGREFAKRACPGAGCDGYSYCWGCFEAYHPRGEEAWRSHWQRAAVLPVVQLKGAALDDARRQLEGVRRRALAAAQLAASSGAPLAAASPSSHVADLAAKDAAVWQGGGGGGGGGGRRSVDDDEGRGGGPHPLPPLGPLTIDTEGGGQGEGEGEGEGRTQDNFRSAPVALPLNAPDLGLRLDTRVPSDEG